MDLGRAGKQLFFGASFLLAVGCDSVSVEGPASDGGSASDAGAEGGAPSPPTGNGQCLELGANCQQSGSRCCQKTICNAGTCCVDRFGACNSAADCCGGRSCSSGTCCQALGGSCAEERDCCGSNVSNIYTCGSNRCCIKDLFRCNSSADCCAGSTCEDGPSGARVCTKT